MKEYSYLVLLSFIVISIIFIIINLSKGYRKLSLKSKKKKKEIRILAVKYLSLKFSIEEEKLINRNFLIFISLIDSLIITTVFMVVMHVDNLILGLVLGFGLLFGLIYSIYELIGRYLKKRGI